jgi:hypothetical protein
MIRVFRDSRGVEWRVWSTHPTTPSAVSADLRAGWLTFDSGAERRRVGPIPIGWETFSNEELESACRVAAATRISDPYWRPVVVEEDSNSDDQRLTE